MTIKYPRTTGEHLDTQAGPTFAVLVWTVPPANLQFLKRQTCVYLSIVKMFENFAFTCNFLGRVVYM